MAKHRRRQTRRAGRWGVGALAVLAACSFVAGIKIASSLAGASAAQAGARGGGLPARAAGPSTAGARSPWPSSAGTAPGSRAPGRSATASPSPRTTSPAALVSGNSVTAIGDSVMVASTPALDQALPGISIDAVVGRQFSTGLQVLADLKAQGQLRPIVVFALGTNGTVTPDEISQLYALVGTARRLVLVNTFEDRSWEQEVNSILAQAAAQHANTVLANWFATIEHRTYLLWPDGIHPQPSGGIVYARMVKAAVERAADLPG